MIRAALLVMLASCFSRPELTPRDSALPADGDGDGAMGDRPACTPSQPSSPGMSLDNPSGIQWIARFEGNVDLAFAHDSLAYPFPTTLTINGENLMAGATTGCGVEEQAGVSVFPVYRVSALEPVTGVHPFDRRIVGPAYTEVQSNWQYTHAMCGTNTPRGNGHTTYSMFPDGRVVRSDEIHASDNANLTLAGCNCVTPDPSFFTITSYTAFALGVITGLTRPGDTVEGAGASLPANMAQFTDLAGACFRTMGGAAVALRWDAAALTRIRNFGSLIFVQDISCSTETVLDTTEHFGGHVQMYLKPSGSCVALNSQVSAHAMIQPIEIAGEQVGNSAYGFFDDFQVTQREHAGPITIRAAFASIPGGFAVRLRIPGYSSITTDRDGADVVWQHEDDDTFYVWFRSALDTNDTITITPECGS